MKIELEDCDSPPEGFIFCGIGPFEWADQWLDDLAGLNLARQWSFPASGFNHGPYAVRQGSELQLTRFPELTV